MVKATKEKTFFEKLTSSLKAADPGLEPEKAEDEGDEEITAVSSLPSQKSSPAVENNSKEEGQLTIDVYQTDTEIVISSPIAGVKPEDIDVDITSDMVTIRGRRETPEPVPQENYFYQECYWGPFSRSIILPQEVDAARSEALMRNGVLTIRLPKIESTVTKKIKVKSA